MYVGGRLHEVQAWNGESSALPPGDDYIFEIVAAKQEASSGKGTPQLRVDVVVRNSDERANQKGVFWYNMDFTKDVARSRMKSLTDAAGIQLDNQGGFDDAQLIGRFFLADVAARTYNATNPNTGVVTEKTASQIQNERMLQSAQTGAQAQAPQQQAFVPQGAPQQQFTAPAPQGQPMQGQSAPMPMPMAGPPQLQANRPAFPQANGRR